MKSNEIILYETADHEVKLNVNTDGDTVWLNRAQLAELFGKDVSVIGRHINNVFTENEVDKESNVQKMHIPNTDRWSVNCRKICNSSKRDRTKNRLSCCKICNTSKQLQLRIIDITSAMCYDIHSTERCKTNGKDKNATSIIPILQSR